MCQVPGISWALLNNSLTQLALQAVTAENLAWKNRKTRHKNLKGIVCRVCRFTYLVADSSPEHLDIAAGQVTGATIAGYYEVIGDYCPSSSKGSKKSLVKRTALVIKCSLAQQQALKVYISNRKPPWILHTNLLRFCLLLKTAATCSLSCGCICSWQT